MTTPATAHPTPIAGLLSRTIVQMDTFITVGIVRGGQLAGSEAALARAGDWFRRVEEACSRFDPASEVRRLLDRVGEPVPVGDILYEATAFALAVAEASGGAFDPTVGQRLERHGFDRDYRTGATSATPLADDITPTYRDLHLDPARRTVTLLRPLVLDLGAVAKGLAIDLAGRELAPYRDWLIEAGGDILVGGHNPAGAPWRVGIRHPRRDDALLTTLHLTDAAVCTSGDYERRAADPAAGHHLLDPRSGDSPAAVASVTVVAPTAMAADALGTAAFILGPRRGSRFLARQGVAGLLVVPDLTEYPTADFERLRA
ncbi:MAG TPA: FAD:protein FMN transferase [Thermomicrobiales bacterium]|jgi:thiamine biosynthesis lipoprotein